MSDILAGLLGAGATYRGDLVFEGRVRIDGEFIGELRSDDLVEVALSGMVRGRVVGAQVLVAGRVEGTVAATERCTLMQTAVVHGEVLTPWLDVRAGCQLNARVLVERGENRE